MTSSRAVGRCVRHRGHRDTEDTEEFRDFASTTLPTTDGRICCLAITAGAPICLHPLSEALPPLPGLVRIGIGQSMGGCLTVVMQGRHATFDAIAPLGYSAIHTVLPQ